MLIVFGRLLLVTAALRASSAPNFSYLVGTFMPGLLLLIGGLVLGRGSPAPDPQGRRRVKDDPDDLDDDTIPSLDLRDTRIPPFETRTNLFVGMGLLCTILGSWLSAQSPDLRLFWSVIILCGAALFIWGCVNYARWKGRSGWFGLLGYFWIFGLLGLVFLSNRRKQLQASRGPGEAEELAAYDRRPGFRYLLTLLPIPLLLIGGIVLVLGTTSAIDAKEWQDVDRPELGFRALMPGTPKLEEKITPTPVGKIEMRKFLVTPRRKSELFMILAMRFPDVVAVNLGGAEKMLELGRKDLLEAAKGEIKSERRIDLAGVPGLELEVAPGKGAMVKSRIFATKNQLYQVAAHVPQFRLGSEDVAKFLDSFKLTDVPNAPVPEAPR